MSKNIYERLFGTPYSAAAFFAMQCFGSNGDMCDYCPFDSCDETLRRMGSYPSVRDKMIEWLKEDVE